MEGHAYCTECGAKLEPKTAFCTDCGAAVSGAAAGEITSNPASGASTPKRMRSRQWIIGAAAMTLIVVLGLSAYHQYASKERDAGSGPGLGILGGKPRLIGQWYPVTELQLGESDDLPFIELFKDNTLLKYESRGRYKGKYPGTWTDLEDGRVKIQVKSPLGTETITIGKLNGRAMELDSQLGGGTYVNGLDQARDYVRKSVHPTVDTVMELIDRADQRRSVQSISFSGRPGSMAESTLKCKDYTAKVDYTIQSRYLPQTLWKVVGFVCFDRNEEGVFTLAERNLRCVDSARDCPL